MSQFANVVDGIVVEVVVASQETIDTYEGLWLQTSYNTRGGVHYGPDGKPDRGVALRMNFAGIGYSYNAEMDAFIPPQPYPDWILDTNTCLWIPPIPEPKGGGYYWDQSSHSWLPIISSAG